ncbi:MAG: hypothetical protein J6M62_01915 [Selenomonadaceae bacterium]|nr:hypothetical protein [Selenomonadaceae bacterium]MBP3721773.1 hypothetical protein [Selenomonadaceae bacterium]
MPSVADKGIMEEGMACLEEHLGSLKAQMFVSALIEDNFDYTKWRETSDAGKSSDTISKEISEWGRRNPAFMKSFGI